MAPELLELNTLSIYRDLRLSSITSDRTMNNVDNIVYKNIIEQQ